MLNAYLRTRHTLALAVIVASVAGPLSSTAAEELTYDALFDPDKLIEIEITVDDADWDALRSETRSMIDAMAKDRHPDSTKRPFNYYKADIVIDGVEIKNIGLRKKGFIGSLDRKRPSLKVNFKKYEKGRKIAGLDKLTLNNNKQDPSAMNQAIAYRAFRDAGLVAPRMNHAHVTVNGTDLGIYANVESIDDEFIKRHFPGKTGSLYEGTITDFIPGWANKFETKLGKKGDYTDIESVIEALEADDEHLLAELGEVLDIDQFLDFWAVEVLIQHWDGYAGNRNNFFVYRHSKSDPFIFLPWGADAIGARNPFWQFQPPASVYAGSAISRRLYDHPEGRKQYREHMRSILEKIWDEDRLLAEIARIEDLIGEHMTGNSRHEPAVEKLKMFVTGRRAAVVAELDGPAPDWEWPLGAPAYVKKTGTVSGKFSTTWGTLMGSPFGGSDVTLEIDSGDSKYAFTKLGATAGPSQRPDSMGDPSIRIAGRTEDSPKMTMINFGFQPHMFNPGELGIDMTSVFGMAMEIDPSGGGFKFIGLMQGTITLDKAETEKGGAVTGSFDADLLTFSGMGED